MTGNKSTGTSKPASARAEAAAWIARLHGPNRTPEAEAGFRKWLAEDPARAGAFELLTSTWERSGRLRRGPIDQIARWERPGFRLRLSHAALAALSIAVIAIAATLLWLHTNVLVTGVGEQRALVLSDGTRIHLNTATRLIVHYDRRARRVNLDSGEALFEVAKQPRWPFLVTAGNRQIRALGTAFVVRHEDDKITVTLVEGTVTVQPVSASQTGRTDDARKATDTSSAPGGTQAAVRPVATAGVLTLAPGQRVTFDGGAPVLDQPRLDRVTAWERGQVAFDNTTLADAVAEMNRYSTNLIEILPAKVADIRISGVFRVGDSANFAQAVAHSYGLQVRTRPHSITLLGPDVPAQATADR